MPSSPYDVAAPSFDRYRALPGGVPEAIRDAVLEVIDLMRPRLLDLGAGTGRIGRAFVAAGDDYVGVDVSLGMLREFSAYLTQHRYAPALVQADGECLPFRDATFDAVLLIQLVGAAKSWRHLVSEARRVLRSGRALIIGHTVFPHNGIDAQMKKRLAAILQGLGAHSYHMDTHRVDQPCLDSEAKTSIRIRAARWTSYRSPYAFLDRQPTGARFSTLLKPIQVQALHMLERWAVEKFGSLGATFEEQHEFELKVFKF